MDPYCSPMDPYYEQRLKEEVIYLHSLWHQGPPQTNPNPNCYKPTHLRPISNHFKKPGSKRPLRSTQSQPNNHPPAPVSDIEWPCPPPPEPQPETYSAWPVLNLPPKKTKLPSPEEQARFFATKVQQKALKMAQEFFGSNGDSDDESEDEDDLMEEDECDEYRFLMRVFMQDRGIRAYYEKNYEKGEFSCLVCGGSGEKIGKRFKDCVALVQHSVSIAKTKKRRAHRAYGLVICKVLGWDINRLPTIVSSMAKPGDSQGNGDDGHKEDSNILRDNVGSLTVDNGGGGGGGGGMTILNADSNVEVLPEKAVDLPNGDGEFMVCEVCENSLTAVDGNKTTEDLEQRNPNMEEGNADRVVNHLGVPNIEERNADGVVNHLQPCEDGAVGSGGNEVKDDQKDSSVLDGSKEGDANQI